MATTYLQASAKHKIIVAPSDPAIKEVIPWAKEANDLLLIPHRNDEVRILRNMGYIAPAPILSQYDWAGDTPFKSQKTTAALLTTNPRAYVLSAMGCGKTRAALHAANYLMNAGEIRKVLVIAPLSTLSLVWENEIFSHFYNRSSAVLHGLRDYREKRLSDAADFYIINHDGVYTIAEALIKRTDIDLVIIDELAAFRNQSTRRWKTVRKVLQGRKYIWGLTGVPTPNAPTDAWAQCCLITPGRVPKYFGQFRDQTMRQVSQFKWVARSEALNVVNEAMRPSVRFTREDCIELPPVFHSNREVKLSDTQQKLYDLMFKKLKADFAEHQITAANEGVKLNKLLQICCGWVYSDKRGVVNLEPESRLTEVKELIEQAAEKVIVFVPYIHAINNVYNYLSKFYSCEKVYGETTKTERDKIFNAFKTNGSPRVLIAHPKTMAHGLTLVSANTIIWFSPPQSLELYLQANARITRPGQKSKQFILHLIGSKIEKMAYARLERNDKLQGVLLDMLGGVNET